MRASNDIRFRRVVSCAWLGCALLLQGAFGIAAVNADAVTGLDDFRQGRFAEAQQAWRAAAASGDGAATLYLGVSYDVGVGVPADGAQAAAWYQRGADLGNSTAAFNLGVLYDIGRGMPMDRKRAAALYQRAADQGYARADYNLGLMYRDGSGVPRDPGLSRYWFGRARRQGITAAGKPAGYAAASPTGTTRLGRNSDLDSFQAAETKLLTRGPQDLGQAVQLFRAAADRDPLAAYDLGYCYENGLGISKDAAQAVHWYDRAAALAQDSGLRTMASNSAAILEQRLGPPRQQEAHRLDRTQADIRPAP